MGSDTVGNCFVLVLHYHASEWIFLCGLLFSWWGLPL